MFPTRYLCCQPEMPVRVLKKFVQYKFDINTDLFNVMTAPLIIIEICIIPHKAWFSLRADDELIAVHISHKTVIVIDMASAESLPYTHMVN